jgi:uncharacterized protein (DUF2141 family)
MNSEILKLLIMKRIILTLFIVNMFITNVFSQIETTLTVNVTGFESNVGQALLQIFRESDDMPIVPFMTVKVNIANNEATFSVKNLTYGDYAVIVVHDQNSNGEIDHSWGIPCEPLGFSNDWKLSLLSGMPTFEKLKFTYSRSKYKFVVKMGK